MGGNSKIGAGGMSGTGRELDSPILDITNRAQQLEEEASADSASDVAGGRERGREKDGGNVRERRERERVVRKMCV